MGIFLMTTNVIVIGALGKMGREIVGCALDDTGIKLIGCVEHPGHPQTGLDIGECLGRGKVGIKVTNDALSLPVETGVIIDFTSPRATMTLCDGLVSRKTSMVIGTTGMSDAEIEKIKKLSVVCPVVLSPNMSLGVNLLFHLTDIVASRLKDDFDIEIIEAHHRFKKDAPSGTAKKLGEIAASAIGSSYKEAVIDGRRGMTGERTKKEIGMHAVRGGDIVGDHTVMFAALGERLELRHMMHSRSTLARGAIVAAKWLSSRKPGFYTMREVLGF
jgi:4-hydroxy-tetrahydrodipicolinate reductase